MVREEDMSTFGLIGLVGGGAAACLSALWLLRNRKGGELQVRHRPVEEPAPALKPVTLLTATTDHAATILGEIDERRVLAALTFHEMTQELRGEKPSGPWIRSGRASELRVLAGDVYIFRIPSHEDGAPIWLKAQPLSTRTNLTSFYRGTKQRPGPARKFKNLGQGESVPYRLPRNQPPEKKWEIVDIGRFGVETSDECDLAHDGDGLPFVTSREVDGPGWLIFLSAGKPLSTGTGGLFLAEEFNPNTDILEMF